MEDRAVLLVEDNPEILRGNKTMLELAGYTVYTAENLAEARAILAEHMPDLLVLDIMLPDGSGLDFCRELRESHGLPILLLTALDEASDVVRGLRAGGDDYLTKPYDYEVLLARVEALLRRARPAAPNLRVDLGPLVLDTAALRAMVDGRDAELTPREFAILLALAQNEGRYVESDTLYQTVWGHDAGDDNRAVRTQISRLRAKLGARDGGSIEISVSRGEGYRLRVKREQP